ncbi:MAG: MFS transporter [Candidatus Syntrophonatronum acetioxidans]|uniref:MFS transporter n=1 Tax=Candidatus Syntrophonatronum acetioxidans TaxID=1795816 RepID=A0A424YH41_9FIRM|nr:MAG: MFS transporter [Candidatus Syntrophonatronum acetioxidans]
MNKDPSFLNIDKHKNYFHYGYIVLLTGIFTVMGALGFGRFGYTVIMPSMKDGLGLGYSEMGFLASGNFIGYLIFALTGGLLAVKYGPRLVIFISLLIVGISLFLTGLTGGFYDAFFLRVITGLGSGGSYIPVMGLISSWFAGKRRGMAAGLLVGGTGLGLTATGLLIPRILFYFGDGGWRYSWFVLGIIVIFIALLAHFTLCNDPREKELYPIDGYNCRGEKKEENKDEKKGLNSINHLYRDKLLWFLGIIYSLFGFSYVIYSTFFTAYLTEGKGVEEAVAGNLWALAGVLSIFSALIWGLFSDYLGRKNALISVFLFQAVSFGIMAFSQTMGGYFLSTLLFGLTAWSIPGIMAALCGDTLGPKMAPAALGIITIGFGIGQFIGPGLSGLLLDYTSSFTAPFLLSAGTAFLGGVASWFLQLKTNQ